MGMTWDEIKKLKLPKPTYIKTVPPQVSRKLRRALKIDNSQFVCPKDQGGGLCYTCSRKEE